VQSQEKRAKKKNKGSAESKKRRNNFLAGYLKFYRKPSFLDFLQNAKDLFQRQKIILIPQENTKGLCQTAVAYSPAGLHPFTATVNAPQS